MGTNQGSATVKTTQTSLDILETIRDLDGARLVEVADELDVAKSTAHKHLTTLEKNGYLLKEGDTYHIGLRFLNFGEYARERWPGFEYIKEAVAELTGRTDEECDFVAEDHGRITTIVESYHKWVKYEGSGESSRTKEYRARIGSYYYMHSTASGLAILAAYPTARVEQIVNQWGLPARTDYTITSQEELFRELDRIRERGYAVDDQGYTEGMRSIGKEVRAPDGSVLGALSVSGPTYRVDGAVLEREIPEALDEVVESLEATLAREGPY
ncbi:MAG: IclR family transcriptional regulator [Haloarculaceae archaeon]